MKHLHFLAFALCWLVWGHLLKAQSIDHYSSLDPSQPIEFKGNCLRYADKEIILGPYCMQDKKELIDFARKNGFMINLRNVKESHIKPRNTK